MVPSGFQADDAEPPSRGHQLTTHALTRQSRHAYPPAVAMCYPRGRVDSPDSECHARQPAPPYRFCIPIRTTSPFWVCSTSAPRCLGSIYQSAQPKPTNCKSVKTQMAWTQGRHLVSCQLPEATDPCVGGPAQGLVNMYRSLSAWGPRACLWHAYGSG